MKVIVAALLAMGIVLVIGYSVGQITREPTQRVEDSGSIRVAALEAQLAQLEKQVASQNAIPATATKQRCSED